MVKVFPLNVNADGLSKMLLTGFAVGQWEIECPVIPMYLWVTVNSSSHFLLSLIFLRGKENCSIALKGPGTGKQQFMKVCLSPSPNDLGRPSSSIRLWRTLHTTQRWLHLILRVRTLQLVRPETRALRLCFFKNPVCLPMKQKLNFFTQSPSGLFS